MTETTDTQLQQLISALPGNLKIEEFHRRMSGLAASPWRGKGDAALKHVFPDLDDETYAALADRCAIERQKIDDNLLDRAASKKRLNDLRARMQSDGLDGFIIPLNDEFHGEAAPAASDRLRWLTGFTGSAGLAAVAADDAAIFIDGRYTLQVRSEVDMALFTARHISDEPLTGWIKETFKQGQLIGYDPWLHTEDSVKRLEKAAHRAGAELATVKTNPIDAIWTMRPELPLAPVVPHDIRFSGQTSKDKRTLIASRVADKGCSHLVLTLPDSIAWLLNLRGADLPCTPFALGFAILNTDCTVSLFMDPAKMSAPMPAHLGGDVTLLERREFASGLGRLGGSKVLLDPATSSQWIVDQLQSAGAEITRAADPCQLPKSCKNDIEVEGSKQAHIRDGAALSGFLHWLEITTGAGSVDELDVAAKLQSYREMQEFFQDLSFPTISGAGANGAIVHYRASKQSCKKLEPGSLYLVDSGGQYLDGTTDVTRTIAIGMPTDEMRDRFTRVLKGHIALALVRFPAGTTGSQLDILARQPLWEAGLDYDHGTGHGVGSYLSVHEGPQRISKIGNSIALAPGMIISNEPGYYKTGAYGIRIENLVTVRPCDDMADTEREMLEFETLTLAPIDRNLIDSSMLSAAEIGWLNRYHKKVWDKISPLVDRSTREWLEGATSAL